MYAGKVEFLLTILLTEMGRAPLKTGHPPIIDSGIDEGL
jgi:hypothetical protein